MVAGTGYRKSVECCDYSVLAPGCRYVFATLLTEFCGRLLALQGQFVLHRTHSVLIVQQCLDLSDLCFFFIAGDRG